MSTATDYTDILDLGKEKMNEGDYLKLANFLLELHKQKEGDEILREDVFTLDTEVDFETYREKSYTIKIDKQITTLYKGPKPNKTILYGSVNGVAFSMTSEEFRKVWAKRINFHGIKNITRSMMGSEDEGFDHMRDFKNYLQEREDDDKRDGDEEYHDVDEYNDDYIIGMLFGVVHTW